MKNQDKYREEIQNRSIQPSEGSWNQLSKKLDAHEKLRKTKKWSFLKYVAAILLVASVGFYFFQPKNEIISEEKIENPASKEKLEKEPIINSKMEMLMADAEVVSAPVQQKKEKENTKPEYQPIEEEVVFENELVENTIISNQIEEKPAIITVTNNEVTNTEIEQLLKNAQIKAQNDSQNFDKKGLSAQALLVEVEDDLNKNLKDKLLQTIVANLKTPREITISDRGN